MAEYATTANVNARMNEVIRHQVKRTVTITDYCDTSQDYRSIENRNDIVSILPGAQVTIREVHTSFITYNL